MMTLSKTFTAGVMLTTLLTSCLKSHTCTCKDANGMVLSSETHAGGGANSFKENCLNKKTQTTVNGTVTATTPCEYK
jgi:hypothetical protein